METAKISLIPNLLKRYEEKDWTTPAPGMEGNSVISHGDSATLKISAAGYDIKQLLIRIENLTGYFPNYDFLIVTEISAERADGSIVKKENISIEELIKILSSKTPLKELEKLPETSSVEPISQAERMRKHFFI
ncbi:MAG: hypothetical protein HGB03_02255 [Candidatus Yonathbacteria bacterium]|nr:hypothetical protein [Candidatus Yonathbacteria bacterium]NTW47537.1 hypothetical protein [Candidatus Yonathbacteria bacterium]